MAEMRSRQAKVATTKAHSTNDSTVCTENSEVNDNPEHSPYQWQKIVFFIPQLICYVRFGLLVLMFIQHNNNTEAVLVLYLIFAALDIVDGASARYFDQTSSFGAFLDVVLDNTGRTFLWAGYNACSGAIFGSLEWVVFSVVHASAAKGLVDWKINHFRNAPWVIQYTMSKNFKNPLGTWCMIGQFLLPLYLYALVHIEELELNMAAMAFLGIGRGIGLYCETYVLFGAIRNMLAEDVKVKRAELYTPR
eukprot:CFRG5139T1